MSTIQPTDIGQEQFMRTAPDTADAKSVAAAIRRSRHASGCGRSDLLLHSWCCCSSVLASQSPFFCRGRFTIQRSPMRYREPVSQYKAGAETGFLDDETFNALAADLKANQQQGNISEFAKSLNARLPGARSQILKTAAHSTRKACQIPHRSLNPFRSGPVPPHGRRLRIAGMH